MTLTHQNHTKSPTLDQSWIPSCHHNFDRTQLGGYPWGMSQYCLPKDSPALARDKAALLLLLSVVQAGYATPSSPPRAVFNKGLLKELVSWPYLSQTEPLDRPSLLFLLLVRLVRRLEVHVGWDETQ